MECIDFLIKDAQPLQRIRQVVATVLRLTEADVAVITQIADFPEQRKYQAVVLLQTLPAGFTQLLTLYVDTAAIFSLSFAKEVACLLDTDCLLPSASPNPYEMQLIQKDCSVHTVTVDVEQLDEQGVYCLAESVERI